MKRNVFVSESFRRAIEEHLAGNLLLESTESPLMFGIFGPAGEGKTFQVIHVLEEMGIDIAQVSPAELESPNAGHPGDLLRTLYIQAGENYKHGRPTVILINDIDTVLGNWGDLVQYTVNRQVVYGQLMAFADFPENVSGIITPRVPIILTGNDPTKLYGPLVREQRLRLYTWRPTAVDKAPVLLNLFTGLSESNIGDLLSQFPDESIAFWASVRSMIWEMRLNAWLADKHEDIGVLIRNGRKYSMGQMRFAYKEVLDMANRCRSDLKGLDTNHLIERR